MSIHLKNEYTPSQIIQLVLMFLMSLNFENMYFYIVFLTFSICVIANFRCFRISIIAVFLSLLAICYILFYPPTRASYTTIIKQFSYSMCYLIGLNMLKPSRTEGKISQAIDKQIRLSILVVAMGAFLHYLLNASINISSMLRNTQDYWTGEIVSATRQALLAVMALGVFSIWLVGDYPVRRRGLSLVGLIAIFAYNFVLAGRTILALEVIIICVAFFFTQKNMRGSRRIYSYLFMAATVFCALYMVINNVWGIREWILNSNLSNRFDTQKALSDIRFERKRIYMSYMLDFPFGGGQLREMVGGHAHELYLDAFSDVGIFGYGLIIAVVIMSMSSVVKLIRSKYLSIETRGLILCVFLGINIVFFLEPILQGAPWLFCVFCFVSGVMRRGWMLLENYN